MIVVPVHGYLASRSQRMGSAWIEGRSRIPLLHAIAGQSRAFLTPVYVVRLLLCLIQMGDC